MKRGVNLKVKGGMRNMPKQEKKKVELEPTPWKAKTQKERKRGIKK